MGYRSLNASCGLGVYLKWKKRGGGINIAAYSSDTYKYPGQPESKKEKNRLRSERKIKETKITGGRDGKQRKLLVCFQ